MRRTELLRLRNSSLATFRVAQSRLHHPREEDGERARRHDLGARELRIARRDRTLCVLSDAHHAELHQLRWRRRRSESLALIALRQRREPTRCLNGERHSHCRDWQTWLVIYKLISIGIWSARAGFNRQYPWFIGPLLFCDSALACLCQASIRAARLRSGRWLMTRAKLRVTRSD